MKSSGKIYILLILAWRNVWKNKRRTILTLLTITAGAAMIVLMNSFAKGSHDQMIEDAVSAGTGHIQIHEKGFPENHSIEYAFIPDENIMKALASDGRISSYSPRVVSGVLLSTGKNSYAGFLQGVDHIREKSVSIIHEKISNGGRWLSGVKDEIILGAVLAKNLGVKPGDKVSILSQGFDGSIAAGWFIVAGTFRTGIVDLDAGLCLINIAAADEIFSMNGFRNSIVIRLKNIDDSSAAADDLALSIPDKEIEALAWDRLMPELVQFIVMDDFSGYVFNIILFLVVAFGILNTIQMSVFERIREFGVMLAVGTRPGQIAGMIQIESFFISVLGIVIGCIIGSAISVYFEINPMDYSEFAKEMEPWGISTVIFPARLTAMNLIVTSAVTLAVAQIFTYFPARRAAGLNPVKAIRHL